MGSHRRVDSRAVRSYQANQAYVSNIYCRAIFALGVLDKTPLLAMPVIYVRLYHIFYESDSTLVTYYSGRAASRLGRDSTYRFEPSGRQGFCALRARDPPPANTQLPFITMHTIRLVLHSEYPMVPSFLFSSSFWLSPIHLLVCCIGKEHDFGALNEVTTRSIVSGVLLLFFCCFSTSTNHLHSIFFSYQVEWPHLQSINRFGATSYDNDGAVV
jgi:hypothetical protein